jgi:HTH-type transcriptional repressor of NAD biosynthesis genes|nr:MAG TPA: bifunctional DNA-binding transcriptional repressor/ NMN adenylyltransferase [Caudoviricetes sp.]
MKVGLIFGKFAPLTAGHVNFIRMAVESGVDRLYLFLSFDQKFNDTQTPWMQERLGLTQRLLDLKSLIHDSGLERKVIVDYVDESNIPGYPEGGKAYAELIRAKIPAGEVLTHVFSSEPDYTAYFPEYFPEVEHVVLDAERSGVDISATRIRTNLRENFEYLSEQAKPRFVKRVAIIGVESTGKSTMTERLAHHYATTSTPEIGRDICEELFYSSEFLMDREAYLKVAMAHRLEEHMRSNDAHVVHISDTTNLITHFSALCAGKVGYNDYMFATLSVEEASNFYDLVLYLSPEVEWVADPLRLQDNAEKRHHTNCLLQTMVNEFYRDVPVVHITGTDYEDRINQAIKAIDKLLGEN